MSRKKPTERVKTAKRRKTSSTRWLQRQLNDPFVQEAQRLGYRSRSAFKLQEIDDKVKILKRGIKVVDLGAAPGGWCQVAAEKGAKIVALDILPMDELPDVESIEIDFMDDKAVDMLVAALDGSADIVMSDMAPNTTGHKQTDHIRIMILIEAAYEFAVDVLNPGGTFIAKVFQGGAQHELLARIKKDFKSVKHFKPDSSRKESSEQYLIARGFRGERE